MSDWAEAKLGDVIELITKGTTPKYFAKYGINYIKSQSISYDGRIDKSIFNFIDDKTHEKFKRSQLKKDDILFSMAGVFLGKNALVPQSILPANTNQALAIIRLNQDKALPQFIHYFLRLKSTIKFVNNMSGQSAQPNINFQEIKSIEIPLPPLPKQKAIVNVLSSLDDKIDLLHNQNKTLEKMAETIFRQWFVEEVKDNWEEKPLKEILEFVVDNRGKTVPTVESGIPLIATNCVKNDNIFPTYEKLRYLSKDTYDNWFRSHPIPGDIIFVNKGTPGCVNLVPEPIDFCIAQDMIALRVNKEINNYYLFLYLRSFGVQYLIRNSSVGTTIPHLKKTDLLKFLVPIPAVEKQTDFEKIVTPFFEKMNENQLQIRTLKKLRDNLLPKLMNGKVKINYE